VTVIAIACQKGGVGKTTTAINLATLLALAHQRILVVDLDPQANCTAGFGLPLERGPTIATLFDDQLRHADPRFGEVIQAVPNLPRRTGHHAPALDLIPSGMALELTADTLQASSLGRELYLANLLKLLQPRYDHIFIDAPPRLGVLTTNALAAADRVIIPTQAEPWAAQGIAIILRHIASVRALLNPQLAINGILFTMVQDTVVQRETIAAVTTELRGRVSVFRSYIPRNTDLAAAAGLGLPGVVSAPRSAGARAYMQFVRSLFPEIMQEASRVEQGL